MDAFNKQIMVLDNIIPNDVLSKLRTAIKEVGFVCAEKDYPTQDPKRISLSRNLSMDNPLLQIIASSVAPHIPNSDKMYCERVYVNAYTMMDTPEPHQDSLFSDGVTVLVYLNEEWDWSYGGETVFFEDGEVIKSVLPKPNRVVLFDPFYFHCARNHNILAPKFRYTLILKLKYDI